MTMTWLMKGNVDKILGYFAMYKSGTMRQNGSEISFNLLVIDIFIIDAHVFWMVFSVP